MFAFQHPDDLVSPQEQKAPTIGEYQISLCVAISRASSTSIPRSRTVLPSLLYLKSNCYVRLFYECRRISEASVLRMLGVSKVEETSFGNVLFVKTAPQTINQLLMGAEFLSPSAEEP
jgi:hypothetical protein